MSEGDWAQASAPGQKPIIDSIFDFSAEALGQLKVWLEQSGLVLPPTTIIGGGINSYTPTWTAATVNPTIGNGVFNVSKYTRNGRTINATVTLTMGTTTTFGTDEYYISLPTPAAMDFDGALVGTGVVYDASANSLWTVAAQVTGTGQTKVRFLYTGAAGAFLVGSAAPFTFAQGDSINFSLTYSSEN